MPTQETISVSLRRGLLNGNILFTYTGEVLAGEEAAFAELARKLVAAAGQEPGTLAYEFCMRTDGKTFDVVEIYQDSDSVATHVASLFTNFGADLMKTQKTLQLVAYGNLDNAAKSAIGVLNPEYRTPFAGFIR